MYWIMLICHKKRAYTYHGLQVFWNAFLIYDQTQAFFFFSFNFPLNETAYTEAVAVLYYISKHHLNNHPTQCVRTVAKTSNEKEKIKK